MWPVSASGSGHKPLVGHNCSLDLRAESQVQSAGGMCLTQPRSRHGIHSFLCVHQHQRKLSTIILTEFDGTDTFIKEEDSGCSSIMDNYDLNKI